jgi:hypothetical protein
MYSKQHSVPGWTIALLLMACMSAVAQPTTAQTRREERGGPLFWGGMQLGNATLRRNKDAVQGLNRNNFYGNIQVGLRLNPDWLVGIEVGGITLENIPCPPQEPESSCEVLSRGFGNAYGTVVFNPRQGRWLLQASFGEATYSVDEITGVNLDGYASYIEYGKSLYSREGWGAKLGIGYDWSRAGALTHYGLRAGYEYVRFNMPAGEIDALSYSGLVLSFSVSWY